tara:strand:+ start:1225 stop:3663 length:2439 start_codon:yes stop_codon:yes gene_type:complete
MIKFRYFLILFFISFCGSINKDGSSQNNQSNVQDSYEEQVSLSQDSEGKSESSISNNLLVDNFVACMQDNGLNFYFDTFDKNDDPLFIYNENSYIDGMMIFNDICFQDSEALGVNTSSGLESFVNYVVSLLLGAITEEVSEETTNIPPTTAKKTCTEYGCFEVFTEIENWQDGYYADGGLSASIYTGYENIPLVNDGVEFDNLSNLEKSSRSSALAVVNVLGDRCYLDGYETVMVTQPYTGFFIDKNHIVTTSKIIQDLQFQEDNNWTQFGSSAGGYPVPCEEVPEMIYGPGNTSNSKTYQGEGIFIQLFNGDWGLGKVVQNSEDLAIIRLDKYSNNFESLSDNWDVWRNYNDNIKALPIANSTKINNQEVVLIHNPNEGSFGGGWKTTLSNLSNCPENNSNDRIYHLDIYSDEGSLGAPVVDESGFVVGVAVGSYDAVLNTCSIVKFSSNRNSLGPLSNYLADDKTITGVLNSLELSSFVENYSKTSKNLEIIRDIEISDVSWPKNALTNSEIRVERIDWGKDFTDSGFPRSEINTKAIEIAKQGTLMFIRQTGCVECETKEKDLDFAGGCVCTAFAVTNDLIVTNDHCVSQMSIGDRATFKTYFGQLVDAELIGMSSIDGDGSHNDFYKATTGWDGDFDSGHKGDVALFRSTQVLDLNPVVLADSSKLNQYDPLIAVGHPGIMNRTGPYVVSVGSFIGKNTWAETQIYYNLPSAGGNSGSGVFNLNGEVIGQIAYGQNFSMAEVASIVYSKYGLIATELINNGTRGASIRPQPWKLTSKVDVTVGLSASGAPSNYIKELIELWAPGELGY